MAFPKGYGADFLRFRHNFSTFGGVGRVKTQKKRTGSKKIDLKKKTSTGL